MPTPRRFGQEIDQNVRRKPNTSQETRNRIIGMLEGGARKCEAADAHGCSPRTVQRIWKKYKETGSVEDLPRTGRPPILSTRQKKLLYRAARKDPKITYAGLEGVAQVTALDTPPSKPPSHSTLYRTLKVSGLTNYRCKKRPKLSRGHALLRLKFCREYRHYPWKRRPLKFSDECSLQKGSGHTQEWCFRYAYEKWDHGMITEASPSRPPAQMVWGAIWLNRRGKPRRSPLVIMKRDPDAPHNGYSAQSYIQALKEGLLPHHQLSQRFMHDNAPIHAADATTEFFEEHNITPIEWPPYSPDLNPIEHLW